MDGAYTEDPMVNPDAIRIEHITYLDAINKGIKVLDATAFSLCMDNNMPIVVFRLEDPDSLVQVLEGTRIGTLVSAEQND